MNNQVNICEDRFIFKLWENVWIVDEYSKAKEVTIVAISVIAESEHLVKTVYTVNTTKERHTYLNTCKRKSFEVFASKEELLDYVSSEQQ